MKASRSPVSRATYTSLHEDVARLIGEARHSSARAVNAVMTATYWLIGRRIVEFEQEGNPRAEYGEEFLTRLAADLVARFGRGFAKSNLYQMRLFYLGNREILQTASGKSAKRIFQTASEKSLMHVLADQFRLPWSAYVRLLSVKNESARRFYEEEALRGGWSVRQLDRQIGSMFYERTALSRDKAKLLTRGAHPQPGDAVPAEEALKDPFILEFLGLKDEYSESDVEESLILHLERFLLELGGDFTFVGRQRRLRVGDQWFRIDLIFYHRRLRCLVLIDLKTGRFTHADAGQMHLYLNYARRHWTLAGENPPVGLILCTDKNAAVAHYALEGLPNKVMAGEYRTALPDERLIAEEIEKTRRSLADRVGPRARRVATKRR